MRLARVIFRVAEMDRSLRFWSETVGLRVIFDSPTFTFLDAGWCQLVLNQTDEPEAPGDTEIVFEVEDVREAYDRLAERGVPFEVELRRVTTDGVRDLLAAHFHDPDGNLASVTGWVRIEDQR